MNLMSTSNPARRSFFYGAALALAMAGAATVAVSAHGSDEGWSPGLAGAAPAELAEHVARMSEHIYAEVGATAEQKARLDPIFDQAAGDLAGMHAHMREGHERVLQLLTQDTIDRDALERLRADHLHAADEASRRIVQLVADVAEVLTPAQRRILAERIAQHHAARTGWHHG